MPIYFLRKGNFRKSTIQLLASILVLKMVWSQSARSLHKGHDAINHKLSTKKFALLTPDDRLCERRVSLVFFMTHSIVPATGCYLLKNHKPDDYRKLTILKFNKTKFMIDQTMVTTNIELSGYRVTRNLGVVRGITVRSRSILGNIAGGLQTLFGGTISIYVELCEKTREEAFQQMLRHADERGANAIISIRYDANEVISGVNEVLAYGTAVVVERV